MHCWRFVSFVPGTIFSNLLLFSAGSVQEMSQLQMKLQQAQSARTISEDINKALQVSQSTAVWHDFNSWETLKLSLIRLQTEPVCFFSQQEELTELKEQINLYESAIKHGALSLEPNGDWENHLSESYMDLGIKKSKWRNGRIHR